MWGSGRVLACDFWLGLQNGACLQFCASMQNLSSCCLPSNYGIEQGFPSGENLPLGVNFTYPGRKFSDAVEHFSITLVSKQKIGGTFYIRKLARVNGRKNAENLCYRG